MYLEKKVQIEFTEKEKELINNFIALHRECKDKDLCEYMDCSYCPFDSLCQNSIRNADEMEQHMNDNLE